MKDLSITDASYITVHCIYLFKKGPQRCEMYFGAQNLETEDSDLTFRWLVRGYCPFPVHTDTWFVGLRPEEMIRYMDLQGFELIAKTTNLGLATRQHLARVQSEMSIYID